MPPKKGTQKQAGAKGKAGKSKSGIKDSSKTPPLPSTATLDIAAHPYILSLIIDYSPRSTILALLRCSQSLFKAAAPSLYKHLHLTTKQFDKLIEIGNAPAKRGSTSGNLGRSFSPFLREGLERVHTLHITDFTRKWTPPSVPRGCFGGVSHLIITRENSWREHNHDMLELPGGILNRLPKDANLTILIRSPTYEYHNYGNRGCIPKLEVFSRGGRSATIVLLPYTPGTWSAHHWSQIAQFWTRFSNARPTSPAQHNIRVVGTEYTGRQPVAPEHGVHEEPGQGGVTLVRFAEWLKEQEAGSVFGKAEEEKLRVMDGELRAAVGLGAVL